MSPLGTLFSARALANEFGSHQCLSAMSPLGTEFRKGFIEFAVASPMPFGNESAWDQGLSQEA